MATPTDPARLSGKPDPTTRIAQLEADLAAARSALGAVEAVHAKYDNRGPWRHGRRHAQVRP